MSSPTYTSSLETIAQVASITPQDLAAYRTRVEGERMRRKFEVFARQAWRWADPRPLVWNWHLGALCDHLEAFSRRWIRKLIINVPPRSAKSTFTSVLMPAWRWTYEPTWRGLFASYAQDLVLRDAVAARTLMQTDWYREHFLTDPEHAWEFSAAENRKDMYSNTRTGMRLTLAVGTKATGFGGDDVIVDDPHNVKDATSEAAMKESRVWWQQVLPTRVNDPADHGRLLIMQRVREDDITGLCEEEGGWEHLMLPAEFETARHCRTYVVRKPAVCGHDECSLSPFFEAACSRGVQPDLEKAPEAHVASLRAIIESGVMPEVGARGPVLFEDPRTEEGELLFPERYPKRVLEAYKKPGSLGPSGYAAQFQQRPAPTEGAMFKYHWWRFWKPDGNGEAAVFGDARVEVNPALWERPKGCVSRADSPAKPLPKIQQIVGSLDAAFKDLATSDYVVFTIWGVAQAERYLLHVIRARMDFTTTKATLLRLARQWRTCRKWLVEDKANGTAIVNALSSIVPGMIAIEPEGGKEARASVMQPYVEAGQVYLPDGAPWVHDYVTELAMFPHGKHDDQVDSSSQAITHLSTNLDVARAKGMVNF